MRISHPCAAQVGTAELYDETVAVLATRLGVPLADVLYVSAKRAGDVGDGSGTRRDADADASRTDRAAESRSRRIARVGGRFTADDAQIARIRAWAVDTFDLDATDDYALWRGATDQILADVDAAQVARYRNLLATVAAPCAEDQRNFRERECLWKDNGCAQGCLDRGLANLATDAS